MAVLRMKYITRTIVRLNHDKIFLFGDNLIHEGFGGQAKEMRGESNCVGVPTKKHPGMNEADFFNDDEYVDNAAAIQAALYKVPALVDIVVPLDGIGTGYAQLERRAPATFAFLQSMINLLMELHR